MKQMVKKRYETPTTVEVELRTHAGLLLITSDTDATGSGFEWN